MSDNLEDLYPLSPLQGGMLFHAIAEPGQGLYFNQLVCELRGRLDAYQAKAGRRGLAEDPVLAPLAERARAALYTAPCELDVARGAVNAYQDAVARLTATTVRDGSS